MLYGEQRPDSSFQVLVEEPEIRVRTGGQIVPCPALWGPGAIVSAPWAMAQPLGGALRIQGATAHCLSRVGSLGQKQEGSHEAAGPAPVILISS